MSQEKKIRKQEQIWPYTRVNAYLALASVATLVLGYIALGVKPWNSWVSMNVAPVLLVLGYCVLVPATIIYHRKDPKPVEQAGQHPHEAAKKE
jgi:hypothetical protein